MRLYRWRQTVTYEVRMQDVGDMDEESGKAMTEADLDDSAQEWQSSAMPVQYYPEDFVTVTEGPVEFLGMTLVSEPPAPEEGK